ncbi:hypothetical protein TSUD_382200 [Trifolium subterraneum]|uniref:C3H1-type domain-containing protein n=1 Tax=Trifolium subterraneum TaxID=3900 RepID=A0A2Z6P5L9_TRISU|nr:hypothetical protein TSUD_382200 [Trifolium subterraneum]
MSNHLKVFVHNELIFFSYTVVGVLNAGQDYQVQLQNLKGVFDGRYDLMADEQFVDCVKCNLSDINIPEYWCVRCLIRASNVANLRHLDMFKTKECPTYPDCDYGIDCLYLHPGDHFEKNDIHSTLTEGIILPREPPSFQLSEEKEQYQNQCPFAHDFGELRPEYPEFNMELLGRVRGDID